MQDERWTRVVGDGLAYSGPCWLVRVILWPDSDGDYSDIYDGRDATSGKKFSRFEVATSTTHQWGLGSGIPFHVGLYVDAKDSAVETTLVFIPV